MWAQVSLRNKILSRVIISLCTKESSCLTFEISSLSLSENYDCPLVASFLANLFKKKNEIQFLKVKISLNFFLLKHFFRENFFPKVKRSSFSIFNSNFFDLALPD